jgi:hypothetical protein
MRRTESQIDRPDPVQCALCTVLSTRSSFVELMGVVVVIVLVRVAVLRQLEQCDCLNDP